MCLTRITNAILDNDKSILTVSVYDEKQDLYYGMPAVVDKKGIREIIYLKLTDEECNKLDNSIEILKKIRNSYE